MSQKPPFEQKVDPMAVPSTSHVVVHQAPRSYSGVVRASWILILIACGISVIPLLGFASWLIAGPIFLTTFILSIIAMSRGGTLPGILVLLTSIIGGPVFVAVAPFISSLLGLAGTGAVLSHYDQNSSPSNRSQLPPPPSTPSVLPPVSPSNDPVDAKQTLRAGQTLIRADHSGQTAFYGTVYNQNDGATLEFLRFGGWGDYYFPFFKFDVSLGPDVQRTAKATLYLHVDGDLPPNDPQLVIYRVVEDWAERDVTANRHPRMREVRSVGRLRPNWNAIDITDLYKEWTSQPGANHGIYLVAKANNQTNGAFSSSRASTLGLRPYILVDSVKQ